MSLALLGLRSMPGRNVAISGQEESSAKGLIIAGGHWCANAYRGVSVGPFHRLGLSGSQTSAPIRVLPGAHSKHSAPVLCLGPSAGVVKGKLNGLHADSGNITSQLCNLGK